MTRRMAFAMALGAVVIVTPFLLPVFVSVRGSRRDITGSRLHVLGLALEQYAQDYGGRLPPMQDSAGVRGPLALYAEGTKTTSGERDSVFVDPETQEPFQPNPSLSGRKLASFGKARKWTVAFYAPHPDQFGVRQVLMLDGQPRRVRAADWPRVRRASGMP